MAIKKLEILQNIARNQGFNPDDLAKLFNIGTLYLGKSDMQAVNSIEQWLKDGVLAEKIALARKGYTQVFNVNIDKQVRF